MIIQDRAVGGIIQQGGDLRRAAVGLWLGSVFWIVAGLFGLFLAWYRPIGRYQRYLRSTFIKKRK
mgnify:CR=1 FL=1